MGVSGRTGGPKSQMKDEYKQIYILFIQDCALCNIIWMVDWSAVLRSMNSSKTPPFLIYRHTLQSQRLPFHPCTFHSRLLDPCFASSARVCWTSWHILFKCVRILQSPWGTILSHYGSNSSASQRNMLLLRPNLWHRARWSITISGKLQPTVIRI